MTQAVKRACDACHRRKVKCDGINPCRNCSAAQLSCTYNAIPQKKGPKGSRAKVISELRETQRQTSLSAKVQNRINGIVCPSSDSGLNPTPGLLSTDLIKSCVHFYFDNIYQQVPILDRRQIEQQMIYVEQSRDAYCLITSLCAFVMLQPGMCMPANDPYNLDMNPGANLISSNLLLEECLRVRKGYEYTDSINHSVLATNFFIFGCNRGLELHEKAWYYIREATTMIQMANMHKEDYYKSLDAPDAARQRRLYWLFLVTERAYSLQRHRPITLQTTVHPPAVTDDQTDPQAGTLSSFVMLVNLFRSFDNTFITTWNQTRCQLHAQHIHGLQKQLDDMIQSYLPGNPNLVDIGENHSWLKNIVWQLSRNNDESMSFQYPDNISRELKMRMASQFPNQGMELMGTGLIEKLLEICNGMIEYLATQPPSRDPFSVGPRQYLEQLVSIVAMARNSDYRFMPVLLARVTETLPRLVNPMLQNAPENSNMASMDIFDGFGNAGMAQPQMQMSIEPDYAQNFPVDEYDKKYPIEIMNGSPHESVPNSNASNGTPPMASQSNDIGGSFVASPGVISPTVDYPQNISGFNNCTPISEMVMSPLGNGPPPTSMGLPNSQQHMGTGQSQMANMPQGMHNQGINAPAIPQHPMNNIYSMRQPPQRQGSFHLQNQAPMSALSPMSNEMDFGSLR